MALYAIGDIQGCRAELDALLERLAFDTTTDRLWLVGDLVNRGPDSLGVLRRVIALGDVVTCVLGNHDLHLLAVVAGGRQIGPNDTFGSVLDAPDSAELIDWLRRRPLLHTDAAAARVLVHAGIPPHWTLEQAEDHAREVEDLLAGDRWRNVLRTMYGNEPAVWDANLEHEDRHRYTINALTRMRYCDRRGRLDLEHTGPPGTQPADLMPWFEVPSRLTRDVHIVFGHWASLGLMLRPGLSGLDSGCVWGNQLTSLPLDPPGPAVSVECG